MEHLKYVVEDSTIAELLGVQNFTNEESAILELVKNSYDAQAMKVTIRFANKELLIIDDGKGMNEDDIRTNWMHVGKSEKGYITTDEKSHKSRILAGSKGIGRFALARLGSHVTVFTKKANSAPVKWETDWNESTLDDWAGGLSSVTGTKIVISELRDKWTENSINKLVKYLSVTYNDIAMEIEIFSEQEKYKVTRYFEKPELGKNCVTKIDLKYDSTSKTLACDILSDEFQDKAQEYCAFEKLKHFQKSFNIINELESDKEIEASKKELIGLLEKLGDFSAEFYFSLKASTTKDVKDFLYKYQNLPDRYENGVVLYRNAFSISSYEGSKDWLEFGKRSRRSPAAATHRTGAWRVRENQISGKVIIDKSKNLNLKDLSNRQGLDENIYFKIFVKILGLGVSAFERYRQEIIKLIDVKNKVVPEQKTTLVNQIIRDPDSISKLTERDSKALAVELINMKETTKVYKEEKKSTEERYRYDVRILNLFATSGLKATSIAHEIKNDRNSISTNYEYIVTALEEYGLWDELSSPELTAYAYKNVPELLLRNKEINQKLLVFMDTMLDEAEKRRFEPKILNIASVMNFIKANWERDYVWLEISCKVKDELQFRTAEDVLTVIFDNLILNSVQQNEKRDKLNIAISIMEDNGHLIFTYHDDGNGLPPKYIDDPERILIVHETSRKNGHGLGMWIVNNTVLMTGGHIVTIDGHNGFSMEFELGAEL